MNASVQGRQGFDRIAGGNLLRVLAAGGVLLLPWKTMRGTATLSWTLFGLAMALFWSGGWLLPA